ncbi:MAG: ABC transporter ATP-binding protein [Halanaerobiales bacterium]|nr:ABC transporter ATP-binding protein [Halanaerobiales bacterium]
MLKKFLSYYRPHLKLFSLDLVCAFLMTGIDLIFPMITRSFINDIIPNGKYMLFWKFSVFLLFLYAVRSIFQYVIEYWGHVVGIRMQADMRRDLFTHLQSLSFSYYDKARTGQIMSRVISDLTNISEAAHHGPEDLFISTIMLIGGFLVLIKINVQLTLLIFALIPLIIWFAAKKRAKMMGEFRNVRKKAADINAQLESSVTGIRVAKAFTNEDYEFEKFSKNNNFLKNSLEKSFQAMAEFYTGINFLANLLKLTVLVGGGLFVFQGKINYGDLVAYLLYIHLFITPIRNLSHLLQQFQQAVAGFERFVEILEIKPEIQDKNDAKELTNVKGNIIFEEVTFSYDNQEKVLKNINLNLEKGKTLAVVGPSGGGKSTLCNLIPRFYEVESGQILIDGFSIKDITLASLRGNIGVVQQDVFLFSGTIGENILYGSPDATEKEIIFAAKNANIHDFIMQLPDQYDSYVGERGIRLSGGQKQRISIARVFLKNPPILLLDEATSSLDNESEVIIQQALERLANNRTTIVIAHRLSTIKDADRIVVLTENGIQEQGTHGYLLTRNGLYAKLYNAQFGEYTA